MINNLYYGEKTVTRLYFGSNLFWIVKSFDAIPDDYILSYKFNGNLVDDSSNNLNGVVAAGNVQYVAGRKTGTQCASFVNSVIKTPAVLPITGAQLTVSFWLRTTQTAVAIVYELSENHNNATNPFAGYINDQQTVGSFENMTINTGNSRHIVKSPIKTNGEWQHIVATIDRSLPSADEMKIYVDGAELSSKTAYSYDMLGNFVADVLHIGGRVSSSAKFNGALQDFRVYDRILTADERLVLFNE